MKLSRLDHVALYVSDLAAAERFYTQVLGLRLVDRLGDMTLVACGDTNIGLIRNPRMSPRDRDVIRHPLGRAHHAFLVGRDELAAAQRTLEQAGVPTHGPVNWGDHDCFYFLDPDGNLLEIVTPPAPR